ncbi:MAG: hypothetical protein Q9192_003771 [Flavoplaca navasiana]
MEILQLKDSEIGDVTQQRHLILWIMSDQAFRSRTREHQELPSYQWLTQLGIGLADPKDSLPAVFRWINYVMIKSDTRDTSPKGLEYMLQTLLALGADICARYLHFFPLQYLFYSHRLSKPCREEDVLLLVDLATALLENGAELFALSEHGTSIFDLAEYMERTPELSIAIQRAGYDLDEVKDKFSYLQWVFDNPNCGIAESTAIDNAQFEPSFTTELTLRRPIVGDRLED